MELADGDGLVLTGQLSVRAQPWLGDHTVGGTACFPAPAMWSLPWWPVTWPAAPGSTNSPWPPAGTAPRRGDAGPGHRGRPGPGRSARGGDLRPPGRPRRRVDPPRGRSGRRGDAARRGRRGLRGLAAGGRRPAPGRRPVPGARRGRTGPRPAFRAWTGLARDGDVFAEVALAEQPAAAAAVFGLHPAAAGRRPPGGLLTSPVDTGARMPLLVGRVAVRGRCDQAAGPAAAGPERRGAAGGRRARIAVVSVGRCCRGRWRPRPRPGTRSGTRCSAWSGSRSRCRLPGRTLGRGRRGPARPGGRPGGGRGRAQHLPRPGLARGGGRIRRSDTRGGCWRDRERRRRRRSGTDRPAARGPGAGDGAALADPGAAAGQPAGGGHPWRGRGAAGEDVTDLARRRSGACCAPRSRRTRAASSWSTCPQKQTQEQEQKQQEQQPGTAVPPRSRWGAGRCARLGGGRAGDREQRAHGRRLVRPAALPQPAGADGAAPVPGTVLVTGGTGTLAGLTARHLLATGRARRLLLVSRSGPAAAGAAALAAGLAEAGAEVLIAAADAADREAVAGLLAAVPEACPLTGVVHTAGIVDDGVIGSLTPERVEAVMRPKTDPAWILHELTQGCDLDLFVLFSSAAATFGGPGQGNYTAGNAFLDGLAAHRRAAGLPGLSLAWGSWVAGAGIGRNLSQGLLARATGGGASELGAEEGLLLLDLALARDEALLVPFRLDVAGLRAAAARGGSLRRCCTRWPDPSARAWPRR
ncbi:KR domain-containing protein [Streptacidiphilus sp. 4-A2]|nr:KR domain-containing protein [Streptacidiphilus sp. 4-A2]